MAEKKIKIHKAEIPEDLQAQAIQFVVEGIDSNTIEKDIATFVKKKCDEKFTGTWHVVVGKNFGCSITHDTKYVLFFQVDLMHVMLFKSLD
jgi:dynein light chain LC8-type